MSIVVILYMINVDAEIITKQKASKYVPGETLIQNCSARSLYPMTIRWQESRSLFSTIVKTDSLATEGLYDILNSTISIKISLMTPLSFKMRCIVTASIHFQPDNFTKAHGLYQKGLLFEKPKQVKAETVTANRRMTIHCKSILIVLKTNSNFNFNLIQGHHLSPLMSLISQ